MIPKEAQAEICECGYAKNMHPIFVSGRKVQEKGEIFLDWICEKFKAQSNNQGLYIKDFGIKSGKFKAQKGCGKDLMTSRLEKNYALYCGNRDWQNVLHLCPLCQETEWKWKRPKYKEGTFNLSEKFLKEIMEYWNDEEEFLDISAEEIMKIVNSNFKTFIKKLRKYIIQTIKKEEHCDGCYGYKEEDECDTCKPHFDKIRAKIDNLAGVDLT